MNNFVRKLLMRGESFERIETCCAAIRVMTEHRKESMSSHESISQSKSTLQNLEDAVRVVTGQDADTLRKQTLTQMRHRTEIRTKKPLEFSSCFPLIGRGNVMRDKVVDHRMVELLLDESLR